MLRRAPAPLLALVALLAAVVVAGCGSSAASGGPDLTAAVPRDALVYVEATLRPQGGARDGALAAAGKVLHTDDPSGRIRELLQQAFAQADPPVDYAKDIDPWLGDRVGLWVGVPASASADPSVGAIVAVRDSELARTKIEALEAKDGKKPVKRSVDGNDYEVFSGDDIAVAFRDDELLLGQEAAVRRMLTLPGDGGLDGSDTYRNATADLDANRLATYFLDTNRFLDLAAKSDPQAAQQIGPLRSLIGADAVKPVAGSFSANDTRMSVESVAPAGGGVLQKLGGLTGSGAAAPLLKELPASSWAAFAVPEAGKTLQAVFQQLAGALGGAAVTGQLRQQLGLDLQQDVFSWMGDVGVFARGTSVSAVDGGLVIKITDEARAATAFGKFVGLARTRGGLNSRPVDVSGADAAFDLGLPNEPKPVVLARGKGRMVLAYGTDAAAQALQPDQPLEQGDSYAQAKTALGDGLEPSLLVSMPAIVSLVDSSGSADASWQKAKLYLDALGMIATGTKKEGDKLRSRFVVGFK